jgi:CubicO group peptidase (beta-lactamase class C family)
MRFRVSAGPVFPAAASLLLLLSLPVAAQTPKPAPAAKPAPVLSMVPVKPESVGFASDRIERLHALMQSAVDHHQVNGVVTLLARHGKVVDYKAYGWQDAEAKKPMALDTIFRDYSMTKPVTAVAMMILYEEGKWLPSDPITKYIPEFKDLKVYAGTDSAGNMILVPPDYMPTISEVMSHTAGFTYGFFGDTPVDKMYREANLFAARDLHEFIEKLARIPLTYQPGHGWTYSVSMDVEGYLVEKLSGQSLPDFYRDHIYAPLGMRDAGFYVPEGKRGRFATNYWVDAKTGELTPNPNGNLPQRDYATQPTMASGGGGQVSTAEDYFRFAQMLLNGGELDGKRIIAPATVRLMSSNHVPLELLDGKHGIGYQVLRPGFGYGYNCAVVMDPPTANLPEGKGTFFWDGAAGTWFWIDPANDIVFVGMIQRMSAGPASENLQYESRSVVYGALVDPAK